MDDSQCKFKKVAQYISNFKNFTNLEFIGKGSFKETFSIKNSDNEKLALKILNPDKQDNDRLFREIKAICSCNSSLICKLYDFNTIEFNKIQYFYTIEELLEGGTLTSKINDNILPKEQVIKYGSYLSTAIKELFNKKLVHRDIKPDNIMFRKNSNIPVLVDLGLVRDLSASSLTQSWVMRGPGTPFFASPEQLNNEKHLISWKSDQFSLGIVLSICLTGFHPYGSKKSNPVDIVNNVAKRKGVCNWFIDYLESINITPLSKCVEPWPIRRYNNIDDFINIFNGW